MIDSSPQVRKILAAREAEVVRLRTEIQQLDKDREQLRHENIRLRALLERKDAALAAVPRILYGLGLDARQAQIAQKAIEGCRKALEAK